MLNPLPGLDLVQTSPWGYRKHPVTGKAGTFHNGIDMRAPQGTPVIAPEDGTVISVMTNDVCGYGVVLQHGPNTRTGYCHFSRIDVKKGQTVKAGQQIGLSGGAKGTKGAGRSTGAHLHFIVYQKKGTARRDENHVRGTDKDWPSVDPLPLLDANSASSLSFNPFAWAKELWDAWWGETPDPMPEDDHDHDTGTTQSSSPAPAPLRVAPTPPKPSVNATWSLGATSGRSMRLTAQGRPYSPGAVPGGVYRVEVWNGQSWVATGSVTLQGGHSYVLTVRDGRIQLVET